MCRQGSGQSPRGPAPRLRRRISTRPPLAGTSSSGRRLALPDDGGILIAQETAEGILLRPGKVVPADIYTEEEVAEYKRADEELRAILPKLKKPARTPRKR